MKKRTFNWKIFAPGYEVVQSIFLPQGNVKIGAHNLKRKFVTCFENLRECRILSRINAVTKLFYRASLSCTVT